MLDRFRQMFSQEEIEVHPGEAVGFFQERKDGELEDAREEAEKLRSDSLDSLEDLSKELQILREYDHELETVEAVTSNIARERERMLEGFEPPEDISDFYTELEDLVESLREMSRKEEAVVKEAGEAAGQVFRKVKGVEKQLERIGDYLDSDYRVLEQHSRLEELSKRREELLDQKSDLEEELREVDVKAARSELGEVKEQIQELESDPRQEEVRELQKEIDELEDEKKELRNGILSEASRMERGLKKLLYAVENHDLEMDERGREVLGSVKEGDVFQEPVEEVKSAVETAEELVEDAGLGDRQVRKFREAADELKDLDDVLQEIEGIESEIEEREEELGSYDLEEEMAELEREKSRIQKKVEKRSEERKDLKDDLDEVKGEIDRTVEDVEEILDEAVGADVELSGN
ncbi:MAG: hypothetical protein MUP63_03780 [Candidatus Nanohaloarchaeota archaeon QJJ-7]|nr:hypothetical protein [Candidatus Nanohaloarchaeota archaeon QJJ-7]